MPVFLTGLILGLVAGGIASFFTVAVTAALIGLCVAVLIWFGDLILD